MAEGEGNVISDTVESVVQKFKDLPAAQPAGTEASHTAEKASREGRLFGREKSVHELLGAGKTADILLWRDKKVSACILAIVTTLYVVFEWLGWHLLPVLSIGSLVVLGILFLWSNLASLIKRSPPNVPFTQVSEDKAIHLAQVLRDQVNLLIDVLRDVVLGKDIKLFVEVELSLWFLSLIGKWADFLTLAYLCMQLKGISCLYYARDHLHENKVDRTLKKGYERTRTMGERGYEQARKLGGKLHDQVLLKIPHMAAKEEQRKNM
ncbi:hypothetical protein KP509_37G007000 [Ceratopteris richardii]|uniref:Reticulon-like protein n=1 Tax=Ceratopteris richardii TaxID=49495 RepID=A0A8T2Q680_CERRI|nr:hypothetical protein KP509_37G007000 [Ceratopteris richardii]